MATAAQMKPVPAQNFENHAKIVPLFHMVALPILALNFVYAIVQAVRYFSFSAVVTVLLATSLIIMFLFARIFALTVQDRVIRLEMRLRMAELLPADLKRRIPEFTVAQLVSLRFAGDEELPELARKVLDGNLQDRKTIKRMIRNWQPDHLRA